MQLPLHMLIIFNSGQRVPITLKVCEERGRVLVGVSLSKPWTFPIVVSLFMCCTSCSMSWRHEPGEVYLLDGDNKDGDKTFTDPPIQWLERYGLLHGKKFHICRCHYLWCRDSGSHLSHGLTSLMATSMRAIACHKRRQESLPSVHASSLYILQNRGCMC